MKNRTSYNQIIRYLNTHCNIRNIAVFHKGNIIQAPLQVGITVYLCLSAILFTDFIFKNPLSFADSLQLSLWTILGVALVFGAFYVIGTLYIIKKTYVIVSEEREYAKNDECSVCIKCTERFRRCQKSIKIKAVIIYFICAIIFSLIIYHVYEIPTRESLNSHNLFWLVVVGAFSFFWGFMGNASDWLLNWTR